MPENEFIFNPTDTLLASGEFSCLAPSNIALVKYWGKYGTQLPKNPSLSFTLSTCSTKTILQFEPQKEKTSHFDFEVFFEGRKAPHFKPKIETFFSRVVDFIPFIRDYHFSIHTSNTFPHSSGIASSASGMAALAACLIEMEKALSTKKKAENYYDRKMSFLARLGSGSAARSILGPIMIWGKHQAIAGSSNDYAVVPSFSVHPIFENYQDTILLVDKGQKKVSSTIGHKLMENHPFAEARFHQARTHLKKLVDILKTGDLKNFMALVESEALSLHAVMLTSMPYYILMRPNTLAIIEKIWEYRESAGKSLCFTLDAGANVHLLYPEKEKDETLSFIKEELAPYCENGHYICDYTGLGYSKS